MTHAQMYARLLANDASCNGRFFTGVLTTGIYCLPSCRARKPKSANVRFFPSVETARAAGLRYVYTGNVYDPERQHTYCPGCGQGVIERDGYILGSYRVRQGRCMKCGTPIAGRLEDEPGDWGGRRLPVRIGDYASKPSARRLEQTRTLWTVPSVKCP